MALTFQKKTEKPVEFPYSETDAQAAYGYIKTILDNTTLQELQIIAKVAIRPSVKKMALNAAKSLI